VTALSILQLLPYPLAHHPKGSITFRGQELVPARPSQAARHTRRRHLHGVSEPMTSLNPLHTIEKQVNEVLILHKDWIDQGRADCARWSCCGWSAFPSRIAAAAYPLSCRAGSASA
jgi:ABC-type microcin C transport system duplicated ATPase subunit YejF